MRRLILAGLPFQNLWSRNKGFEQDFVSWFPGWDASVIWSNRKTSLVEAWPKILEVLEGIDNESKANNCGGIHILAFHTDVHTRQHFKKDVADHHRLCFLSSRLLHDWGQPAFKTHIENAVYIEELWRDSVRPTSSSHPLLLPRSHFRTTEALRHVWNRAEESTDRIDIENVAALLRSFSDLHREEGCFNDILKNEYRYDGPRHAYYHGRDDWKYAYRMEDGFHYDVQAPPGKNSITVSGETFRKYVNVYPNGSVRGTRS